MGAAKEGAALPFPSAEGLGVLLPGAAEPHLHRFAEMHFVCSGKGSKFDQAFCGLGELHGLGQQFPGDRDEIVKVTARPCAGGFEILGLA